MLELICLIIWEYSEFLKNGRKIVHIQSEHELLWDLLKTELVVFFSSVPSLPNGAH
jgi:hypothetical protein